MEMHEVRYFLALAETLNFTRAAERCNISQPTLSRAIRNLEEKLGGGPLVNRERNNTHMTELGRIMRPYLEAMSANLLAAKTRAEEHVQLTGASLRVGLMSTIGPTRLVDLFSHFGEAYPAIDISLADGPVPVIEKKLLEGDLDVAVFARPDPLDERFHAMPLFEERFLVAIGSKDPLARQNAICMSDLHEHHYLGRASCEFYEHLRRIRLEIGGIEFRRRYSSDRDDWVQCMVLAGLGFTYIPEFAVALPNLVTRPLVNPEVRRTVQLVTVRGRRHTACVGAFVRAARGHAWAGKLAPPPTPEPLG